MISREQLIEEAKHKPMRRVFQADALSDLPPDHVLGPDEDGDILMCRWQDDLRAKDNPVRVQILHGTDAETASRCLVKLAAWVCANLDELTEDMSGVTPFDKEEGDDA